MHQTAYAALQPLVMVSMRASASEFNSTPSNDDSQEAIGAVVVTF